MVVYSYLSSDCLDISEFTTGVCAADDATQLVNRRSISETLSHPFLGTKSILITHTSLYKN